MLEMATGFGIFANGGERATPILIKKIVTMQGEVIEENYPYVEMEEEDEEEETSEPPAPILKKRILSPQNAFIMTHLLEGVVQHGTGQRAKVLGRPIAGKTGTSNDYTDALFIGYPPSLLTGVWVGFDDRTSLGKDETGARSALPIWIFFMDQALKNIPIETFKPPPGITLISVNMETGQPSRGDFQEETILEAFIDGSIPKEKEESEKAASPLGSPLGGSSFQDPFSKSGS